MLTDELKQIIQSAYSSFLDNKGLKARYGQRLMVAEIARTLANVEVDEQGSAGQAALAAIEAGTGTGKTVAYSVAAIPLAQHFAKKLVVATATVALQEQLVNKDLPDLRLHSGLNFSFTLAKGRARYICISKLDNMLNRHEQDAKQARMLEAEDGPYRIDVDQQQIKLFAQMLERLGSGKWAGDRDSWPDAIEDESWGLLTTDHIQCSGRRCSYYQQCAFYRAREGLDQTDVIVTNHDMVLADLALGGGIILPEPNDSFYIFDEGHHLADKAISHFARNTRLKGTREWLQQLERQAKKTSGQHPYIKGQLAVLLEQIPSLTTPLIEQQNLMFNSCEEIADFSLDAGRDDYEKPRYRFANGQVPEPLRLQALELKKIFLQLADSLAHINEILKKSLEEDTGCGLDVSNAEALLAQFGLHYPRAENNFSLWSVFSALDPEGKTPTARWLTLVSGQSDLDIEVSVSPILAADNLRQNLWNRAGAAILTSATLTALGRFERLLMRTGLPDETACLTVPSPFNHAASGVLHIPDWNVDVRNVAAHTSAIVRHLPELLEGSKGALVLFSSRRQMQDVFQMLDVEWRKRVLLQGRSSRQETLERHRARVDEQQPSVLFGLASFAEGIDLPGDYCQHVVIAKIPFSVPDEPVEAALAEWIEARGGNPFMEISVPDASLRLIQACGRLLRNEQDSGTISILDRRLVTQRYGKAILDSLPAFRRQID